MLLVRPSCWEGAVLVGGDARADEPPHVAAYRTVVEQTGWGHVRVRDLLLVEYVPRNERGGEVEGLNLVFDGGTLPYESTITLPAGLPGHEPLVQEWLFCAPEDLARRCGEGQARRIREALAALADPSKRGLRVQGSAL